jgi:hypothetical protein
MNFPLYLYYEVLVRVREVRPNIGEYQFALVAENSVVINTTMGKLHISKDLLLSQFKDPDQISIAQIEALASQFCLLPNPCMFV